MSKRLRSASTSNRKLAMSLDFTGSGGFVGAGVFEYMPSEPREPIDVSSDGAGVARVLSAP